MARLQTFYREKVVPELMQSLGVANPMQVPNADRAETVGGVIEKEGPIHISNVMLIDPKDKKHTRVGVVRQDGVRNRVTKRSGTKLD